MTEYEIRLTFITLLCSTQVLLESLDDLEDTDFYKQSLKHSAKKFEKELTKICVPHINDMFAQDDQMANAIMDTILQVSKELATLDPVKLITLSTMIQTERKRGGP